MYKIFSYLQLLNEFFYYNILHIAFNVQNKKISIRKNAPLSIKFISERGFNNLVRNFNNSYYSTVTDLAKFLGLSTSVPFANAT